MESVASAINPDRCRLNRCRRDLGKRRLDDLIQRYVEESATNLCSRHYARPDGMGGHGQRLRPNDSCDDALSRNSRADLIFRGRVRLPNTGADVVHSD